MHWDEAATTNGLISLVTTHTTSWTKVLEKYSSTENNVNPRQISQVNSMQLSSTSKMRTKITKRNEKAVMTAIYPQRLSAGTLCYISCPEKSKLTNFYLTLTCFYVKYYQGRSQI